MTVEALKRTADRRLVRVNELETVAHAMLAALEVAQDMAIKATSSGGRTIGHPDFVSVNHSGWGQIAEAIAAAKAAGIKVQS